MQQCNGGMDKSGEGKKCDGRAARTTALIIVCLLGFVLLLSPNARAQTIRAHGSGYGLSVREANTAAKKAGRADWPTLRADDGTTGTQVHISFNARNADVAFVTLADYSQDKLLVTAQAFARDTGFPRADYITYDNTRTSVVDVELNKYLRPLALGKNGAEIDLPLGKFAQTLAKTDLPKPIVFYISGDGADDALLQSAHNQAQPIGDATFLSVDETLKAGQAQTVHFRSEISPLAYVVAGGFVLMFAFPMVMAARLPWVAAKARRKAAEKATQEPDVPDPAEVQRKYNQQKPVWVKLLPTFIPFLFIPLLVIGLRGLVVSHAFAGGMALLSPVMGDSPLFLLQFTIIGSFVVGGVSWATCLLLERRREKQAGVSPLPKTAESEENGLAGFGGPLIAMAASLPLMFLVMLLPRSARVALGPSGVHTLIYAPMWLGFAAAALLGFRNWKKSRTTLLPGDPWHDLVMEVAQKAGGVRVKHVVLTQSSAPNASASILDTVALTRGLIAKMESDEVRVVVAHEIAHLKSGHAKKTFAVGMAILAVYFTLYFLVLLPQKSHVSPVVFALLGSPAPGLFLGSFLIPLLTGRGRRQREHEADRLAAQIVGDPEAVIHTLRKLHTLSATPHHLKPSDELLSSHPSLAHRIDALRQMQPGP